ncbi:PREDICTED: uncharacterized protein LOC105362529 [Ceratosolen solmsi marchali]|uniref:Uncharacterized protein LOC105362529 n=1 Tax=Ceratosolen solmsi marchali TaxID=326594 RepID=A0AAJ7DVV1_9HYME|nr:PREDICTED: uncharacterized protein LOC105362529 [Ceratosolen solmsi marchali]
MGNITRLTLIKLLELILVCILLGLQYHTYIGDLHEQMLATGTFGGYLIILVGLFAGGIMATPVNRRVDLFFSLVGCALFIAVGSMVISNHQYLANSSVRDKYMAKGSISIIEGFIFLVDAILTFRGEA